MREKTEISLQAQTSFFLHRDRRQNFNFSTPVIVLLTLLTYLTLLMSGENVAREIDGQFAQKTPHFPGHYFFNWQFNQLTRDNYWELIEIRTVPGGSKTNLL